MLRFYNAVLDLYFLLDAKLSIIHIFTKYFWRVFLSLLPTLFFYEFSKNLCTHFIEKLTVSHKKRSQYIILKFWGVHRKILRVCLAIWGNTRIYGLQLLFFFIHYIYIIYLPNKTPYVLNIYALKIILKMFWFLVKLWTNLSLTPKLA